eukprot:COSAG03_NODE_553_length_6971_cov_3.971624_11_plen_209_part_00
MPLKFVGNSSLRWDGVGGEQLFFSPAEKGWEVTGDAVVPPNSVWRKNPIPHTVNEWFMYGATFEPVCEESEACRTSYDKTPSREGPNHRPVCKCSGDWNDNVEVVDTVEIPKGLKPGKYVLGWRWDCEEVCLSASLTPSPAPSLPPSLPYSSLRLPVCLSVCPPAHPPTRLSGCLSGCLSVFRVHKCGLRARTVSACHVEQRCVLASD